VLKEHLFLASGLDRAFKHHATFKELEIAQEEAARRLTEPKPKLSTVTQKSITDFVRVIAGRHDKTPGVSLPGPNTHACQDGSRRAGGQKFAAESSWKPQSDGLRKFRTLKAGVIAFVSYHIAKLERARSSPPREEGPTPKQAASGYYQRRTTSILPA
jgi:hypothetical protein